MGNPPASISSLPGSWPNVLAVLLRFSWFPHWMGGSDGPKDIWFEPHAGKFGSFTKDKVELMLWRAVCVNQMMSLGQAKKVYLQGWTRLVPQY